MKTDKLIEQIELYSNAITGFVVVQSLGFAFTLGTDTTFACVAFSERGLNLGLVAHFCVTCALAVTALAYLSRQLQTLSRENHAMLRRIYLGKMIAVVLFIVVPVAVLLFYGTTEVASAACKAANR